MTIINANADPMRRELIAVQRMAAQAGVGIRSGLEGGGHIRSGALREALVLTREISRGNWTRVPGSLTILLDRLGLLKLVIKENVAATVLQAAADEKASQAAARSALASVRKASASLADLYAINGETEANLAAAVSAEEKAAADILAAKAAQAKAVASAEAAEALTAEGAASSFALGPIGWAAAAIIALAGAIYFLAKSYQKSADEARHVRDLMDTTTAKFSEQAEIMRKSAEDAQAFNDWLTKIGDTQETLAKKTQDALKAMREQAKYERELAEHRGATKRDLAQMDIAEAQKELDAVVAAKLEANRKLEADKESSEFTNKAANNPSRIGHLKDTQEHAKEAGLLVDAFQEAIKTGLIPINPGSGVIGGPEALRAANATDIFDVTVNGKTFRMSLNDALKIFDQLTREETRLATIQKAFADLAERKKALTEKDLKDQQALTEEAKNLAADLALKQKYLPQLAGIGKIEHGSVDSLQKIGAYASPATAQMVDIGRKSLAHLAHIDAGISGMNGGKGGNSGGGVKY